MQRPKKIGFHNAHLGWVPYRVGIVQYNTVQPIMEKCHEVKSYSRTAPDWNGGIPDTIW